MKVTRAGVDRSSSYLAEEFDQISIVLAAWDGEVGLGAIPIPDPAGNQEPYEGEQLLLEQDTLTILDGFLGAVGTTRGPTVGSTRRVHTVTLGDDNALLGGHATPGWSRPAESPAARWSAFVAAFLPGTINTTWLLTTNESGITLPKKTYRTDSLFDDLSADTIRPTGKTPYIESRRFHWHLPTEGQTCSIVIHDTNTPTSTSFQPTSASRSKDGMDLRNEIWARNDAGVIVSTSDATSTGRHNAAGLKHQGFAEYSTETAAEMTRDIAVTKAERKDERVTWEYTIGPLTAAQVVQLIPGSQMTVTVGLHSLSAAVKRIARVSLAYRAGPDARRFTALVQLGYPKRFRHKPTKTVSATGGSGSGGGIGSGGGDDCGCPPLGARCTVGFGLPSTVGAGSNTFNEDVWGGASGVSVSGGELIIPNGNAPYVPLSMGQPLEILTRQHILRGTLAVGVDVACRLTILRTSPTDTQLVWLGLKMNHSSADLILELGYTDPTVPHSSTSTVYSGSMGGTYMNTKLRIEPLSGTSSTIRAKFWLDSVAEPAAWNLSFAANWDVSGPVPTSPAAVLKLDNGFGATDTVWYVDSIQFLEGFACGDPTSGMTVPWTKVGQGDGATATFRTPDSYQAGTLEARVNTHDVNVTESGDGEGTLGFNPRSFESVSYRYRAS